MSINDVILELLKSGELHHVAPDLRSLPVKRDVFASRDVFELLVGGAGIPAEFERVGGRAKAKIDHFVSGGIITLALDPQQKSQSSFIARNDPVLAGIVDVRITDPKPMVRIFGGFAHRDALVLLKWHPRSGLHFQDAVFECRKLWNSLFTNTYPPLVGEIHADYLSGYFDIG